MHTCDLQWPVVMAEFRVSMYCNACERSVAKAVSKMKGVEKFVTDTKNHRVVITGRINPQKVMKKLKRKTGKRVELVDEEDHDKSEGNKGDLGEQVMESWIVDCDDSELHMMFNDENANACSIM
ncbi:heavy metal-associated isoprenylated plant protein 19-like isoform X2 [Primulina eburnea]|uniref:heavy metal-associated isoprenylated plant protein 19-like isoform X2 n=1 Tax=Primulina eburnea TaxID=1245227 RepID=UPI003C6C7217